MQAPTGDAGSGKVRNRWVVIRRGRVAIHFGACGLGTGTRHEGVTTVLNPAPES